jgi:hypothetical protein
MADSFSRRQPQKAYPLPADLRNEFSESLYSFSMSNYSGIQKSEFRSQNEEPIKKV